MESILEGAPRPCPPENDAGQMALVERAGYSGAAATVAYDTGIDGGLHLSGRHHVIRAKRRSK